MASILESATTGRPYLQQPFNRLVDTGPGAWNDADFVSAGCPLDRLCGLGEGAKAPMTAIEQRTQVSMWAMIASPIIIGSDIRNLTDGSAHSKYTLARHAQGASCTRRELRLRGTQAYPCRSNRQKRKGAFCRR